MSGRKLFAEFLGTLVLVAAVVGSGIAAQELTDDVGLQLLENTAATVAVLYVLILTLGPVSGAHFNPVVTIVDTVFGGIDRATAAAYVVVQTLGAILGAVLANVMFGLTALELSTKDRASGPHALSEVVATAGLLVVIFALARTGKQASTPAAVAAWIGGAYWFTSSTSFANPAVTVGRMFSDSFAGIAPASVPLFIGAQLVGMVLAFGLLRVLYPDVDEIADRVVVPHDQS